MCVYTYTIYLYKHVYTYIYIQIQMHSSRLFILRTTTTTTTDDEEETPSGRSRLYARPLCAVWPRMGNEGIGGMRSLDTEPTRTWPSKIWRRGIIQRAQKELESLRNVSALLRGTCRVMLK